MTGAGGPPAGSTFQGDRAYTIAMALDVYVMPLWRFKKGDFTSPVEALLGIKPQVISLAEAAEPEEAIPPSPAPTSWWRRLAEVAGLASAPEAEPVVTEESMREAYRGEVTGLKRQVSRMSGATVDWPDEGEVHYAQQFHQPVTLRAFAAWCDHREELPEFGAPPGLDYHQHPVWKRPRPERRRFPTLVGHSLFVGYLFPTPFEGVHEVEPFRMGPGVRAYHDVASTQTIQRELAELLEILDSLPEVRDGETIPVKDARWYAEELQRICALSIEHRLPVIFYG